MKTLDRVNKRNLSRNKNRDNKATSVTKFSLEKACS